MGVVVQIPETTVDTVSPQHPVDINGTEDLYTQKHICMYTCTHTAASDWGPEVE